MTKDEEISTLKKALKEALDGWELANTMEYGIPYSGAEAKRISELRNLCSSSLD